MNPSYDGPDGIFTDFEGCDSGIDTTPEIDSLQGCRESNRTAEGLDAMGNFAGIEALGASIRQHRHTNQSTEIETIDIAPAVKHIDRTTALVADLAAEMVNTLEANHSYESTKFDALKDAIKARKDAQENLLKAVSGR